MRAIEWKDLPSGRNLALQTALRNPRHNADGDHKQKALALRALTNWHTTETDVTT